MFCLLKVSTITLSARFNVSSKKTLTKKDIVTAIGNAHSNCNKIIDEPVGRVAYDFAKNDPKPFILRALSDRGIAILAKKAGVQRMAFDAKNVIRSQIVQFLGFLLFYAAKQTKKAKRKVVSQEDVLYALDRISLPEQFAYLLK